MSLISLMKKAKEEIKMADKDENENKAKKPQEENKEEVKKNGKIRK
jgi:hypothetical protein